LNPWWKKNTDDEAPTSNAPSSQQPNDKTESDNDTNADAGSGEDARDKVAKDDATADSGPAEESKPASRTRRAPRKRAASATKTDDEKAESESDGNKDDEPKPRARRRTPRTRAARKTPAKAKEREDEEADKPPAPAQRSRRRSPRIHNADPTVPVEVTAPPSGEILELLRDTLSESPKQPSPHDERKLALFFDFENIALGIKDSDIPKLDVDLILERLLEKGRIIVKKAYADWERYSEFKKPMHSAAIELIEIPQKYYSGKNSADIKMVVDAMELSASNEHIDTFVIISGDSDFSPLVSKLREHNKNVIGVGVKNSSSKLLIDNCDEFVFYEDIWRDNQQAPKLEGLDEKKSEVFTLLIESIQALIRENKDILWGSMIKQTMQRKHPAFNEGYFGYRSFSELLEEAEERKLVNLKKDHRSGSYIVTGFAKS
jgi:uncharacterized protein (TIGR00288 family)